MGLEQVEAVPWTHTTRKNSVHRPAERVASSVLQGFRLSVEPATSWRTRSPSPVAPH